MQSPPAVPITHKFIEKRVHDFAGRVYTASTFFRGRVRLSNQARLDPFIEIAS